MTTQKFLVQFESNETTRWLYSPEAMRQILELMARTTAVAHTTGAQPAVVVTIEEQPQPAQP